MQPYQQRVVDEKKELDERLTKLSAFIGTPTFVELPQGERTLLVTQQYHMERYSAILHERIKAFPQE